VYLKDNFIINIEHIQFYSLFCHDIILKMVCAKTKVTPNWIKGA